MAWLPRIPEKFASRIGCFTVHRDGFVRKYRGETRAVMGKGAFLKSIAEIGWHAGVDALESRWEKRRKEIDQSIDAGTDAARSASGQLLIGLGSEYLAWLDQRVKTGKPKRLTPVTAWDITRTLNAFMAIIRTQTPVNSMTPDDFSKYVKAIAHEAPTSFARKIAYVRSFIGWALKQGRFANNARVRDTTPGMSAMQSLVGSDLTPPPLEDIRDSRLAKEKAFTAEEFGKLWHVADELEKLWLLLGVTCAFDNGDIMGLVRSVVVPASTVKGIPRGENSPKRVIDYRRRKLKRIRRVIPVVDQGVELMDKYQRPNPATGVDADLYFLFPDGQPLFKMSASGPQNYMTRWFVKLMIRAGLRKKPGWVKLPGGKRKWVSKGSGTGQAYRSLRTSFSNFAPTGFSDEIKIVMGEAWGGSLDKYLEGHGFTRLFELVNAVLSQSLSSPPDESWKAAHPPGRWPALADSVRGGRGRFVRPQR